MKSILTAAFVGLAGCLMMTSVMANDDPLNQPSMICSPDSGQSFCGTAVKGYEDGCFAKVSVAGCNVVNPGSGCSWGLIKHQLHIGTVQFRCGFEKHWLATHGYSADVTEVDARCEAYQNTAINQCHI